MKYILLLVIALSGCSTINMQPGPEGSPMAVAKCGTAHYNLCLMRLGEACPKGFDIVSPPTGAPIVVAAQCR